MYILWAFMGHVDTRFGNKGSEAQVRILTLLILYFQFIFLCKEILKIKVFNGFYLNLLSIHVSLLGSWVMKERICEDFRGATFVNIGWSHGFLSVGLILFFVLPLVPICFLLFSFHPDFLPLSFLPSYCSCSLFPVFPCLPFFPPVLCSFFSLCLFVNLGISWHSKDFRWMGSKVQELL